jgi:hypothetical protein
MFNTIFNNMFWNWIEYNRESTGDDYIIIYYVNKKTGKRKMVIVP